MIVQQARRAGMPIPEKIANRPPLHEAFQFYYRAFWELRSNVTDKDFISWGDLNDWLSAHDVDEVMREETVVIVKGLDTFFIKKMAEKRKRAAELSKANGKRDVQRAGRGLPNAGKPDHKRDLRKR